MGARAPSEFGGSEKGRSLISAYRSLAITTNTPGFKKLSTALTPDLERRKSFIDKETFLDHQRTWKFRENSEARLSKTDLHGKKLSRVGPTSEKANDGFVTEQV